jgi:hypothetical protein
MSIDLSEIIEFNQRHNPDRDPQLVQLLPGVNSLKVGFKKRDYHIDDVPAKQCVVFATDQGIYGHCISHVFDKTDELVAKLLEVQGSPSKVCITGGEDYDPRDARSMESVELVNNLRSSLISGGFEISAEDTGGQFVRTITYMPSGLFVARFDIRNNQPEGLTLNF